MNRNETTKDQGKRPNLNRIVFVFRGFCLMRKSALVTPSSEPRTPWGSNLAAAARSARQHSTDGCSSHGSLTAAAVGA